MLAHLRRALHDFLWGIRSVKLAGSCEVDCQIKCAYPGQFSECSL